MQENTAFAEIVGQKGVIKTLSLYIDAFKETGRLPFLNLTSQKGGGKSFIIRKFREGLRRKDGSKVPLLEVNSATIKNAKQFFEQVVPIWVNHKAFLFLDEIHTIPEDLQSIFLSLLDVKKDPIRTVEFEGVTYSLDFREVSFASATTDVQKLLSPLQDRLRQINLEEYSEEHLFDIFIMNLENKVEVSSLVKNEIISSFRGNPRDAVIKAEDLKIYSSAKHCQKITEEVWNDFCEVMGILPLGLSYSEIQVVRAIGQKREASLTDIASITGLDRSFIQRNLESILVRKNIMSIDTKRKLTPQGYIFYHKFCR